MEKMEKKTKYQKPEMREIDLTVNQALLGSCWDTTGAGATSGTCESIVGCYTT